eukprot:UN12901
MGQIWKSYTFAIKVDARKISERKRTQSNLDGAIDLATKKKNTTIQMPTTVTTQAPLPAGWTARVNTDGRIYYQNGITKQTQWEIPVAEKIEKVTTDNHTSSVVVFACFYIFTLTFLMSLMVFIAVYAMYGGSEPPSQVAAFIVFLSITANAAGLLQHFINISTGTVKKCKASKKNILCVCCGGCFGTIIVIIGVGFFAFVFSFLIGSWIFYASSSSS